MSGQPHQNCLSFGQVDGVKPNFTLFFYKTTTVVRLTSVY